MKTKYHSRRWDVNLDKLRKTVHRLPHDAKKALLNADVHSHDHVHVQHQNNTLLELAATGAVAAALAAAPRPPGSSSKPLSRADADRLVARRLDRRLLAAAQRFFAETLASDATARPTSSTTPSSRVSSGTASRHRATRRLCRLCRR